MGEDFVELAADGAFAGGVSLALDVGGVLKEREDAFLAVFGKGVEIEEFVVRGRGVDLEVPGVNDYAEGQWMAKATQSTRLCVTWMG